MQNRNPHTVQAVPEPSRARQATSATTRDLRVCFVGDSFVNGTGDDEALGWVGRACRMARRRGVPLTRYDLGVRRDTSALVLRRCAAEVAARLDGVPCDGRVVFSFGVNDAAHGDGRPQVEPAGTIANVRELLAWSCARYPTLMVGPPPFAGDPEHDARVAALSAALGRLCAELDVPFLDLHGPLSGDVAWRAEALAGDGVHPNGQGYGRITALIEAWGPWQAWTSGRKDMGGATADLRRAAPADAAAVRELTRAAYAKWVPVIGREPRPMTADYDTAVRDHLVDLLHVDGTLAALIEMAPAADHLLVVNVAVAPAFQGQGHGRTLMAHAEAIARSLGLGEVRLYTNGRFAENIRLYSRLGYGMDREEAHPQFGLTAYMSKKLRSQAELAFQGRQDRQGVVQNGTAEAPVMATGDPATGGTVELAALLASMEPELSDTEMVFCSFPDGTAWDGAFPHLLGFFREREGVTLIVDRTDAEQHGVSFHTVLKRITLTVHSGLEAVGLTAAVTGRLTSHGISANVVAAYYHDHVFVPAPDAERALQALRALQAEASSEIVRSLQQ